MLVKDLNRGKIVWYKDLIVGIKGITLEDKYFNCEVKPIQGNIFDFELTPNSPEMIEELEKALAEQEAKQCQN